MRLPQRDGACLVQVVQQSLGRAAVARQHAEDVGFGVFEIGMNHAGEIDALTRLVRPHIAIVTTVAPVHLGFFRSVEEIADAKAEIFHGLEPGGTAIINRDNPHYERLAAHAREHGAKIVGFGDAKEAPSPAAVERARS